MKTTIDSIDQWLQHEAHVIPGHPFKAGNRACIPMWTEHRLDAGTEIPQGFFVSTGNAVQYLDAHSPEGEQLADTWAKFNLSENLDAPAHEPLPAECWYG